MKDTGSETGSSILYLYISLVKQHDIHWNTDEFEASKYMFAERLRENLNASTIRELQLQKLQGVKLDHKANNHYNFLSLCNGVNSQVNSKHNAHAQKARLVKKFQHIYIVVLVHMLWIPGLLYRL